MSKYSEQYERVKRYRDRFSELDGEKPHVIVSDNYTDDVYSFFQHCHHLKDWIKKDANVPTAVQNLVEPYITANRALRLCADICNSTKHLILTKPPRSQENPQFGQKQYSLSIGGSSDPVISLKWQVDTSTGPIDAFQLAEQCVQAWDLFLAQHGLK